ncbi:MAG: YcbK family protein [Desulfobacterales bacterium]|jgi:uncharacterized protein YcbK (DUF882 family)|nr:YcbK family protein [Desulfobacterales bacterium]MDD3081353.1 YcbK family protein [Desulfobacterales bacterium]MDD3950292.1 YcbK family protein [Desulfobacterales bacterium]MDD4463527.1 YcbK family protein [Desulfobacterales bacterium]MDY0377411.1 YcbK family protein [Desulfobacterales bacterium]
MTRRNALKALFGGFASLYLPFWMQAADASARLPRCSGKLSLYNMHTQEELSIAYLNSHGKLDPKALKQLDHFFRCHHNDRVSHIDPRLYMLLDTVQTRLGVHDRTIQLVSGYRSPEYNRMLRSRSSRVAKHSYHTKGMAADIQIEGVRLSDIKRTAMKIDAGGVGVYSEFIHLDVGPSRTW